MRHAVVPGLALIAAGLAVLPVRAATLTSERLQAQIEDSSGKLLALTDRRDGIALLGPSPDRYAVETSPGVAVSADESGDLAAQPASGLSWTVTNPALPGIRIVKTYELTERWLSKRVEFTAAAADIGLLKHTVTSTVPSAFYRDGYLNDPSRHPLDYPYLATKDLQDERQMRDSHAVADHHWAIFTNPRLGRGLAQYRFTVDGRYVQPLSSYAYEPGLTYTPTGWRVAVACAWMSSGRPGLLSECRWHLFDGDHIAFHEEYLQLPEVRAEWDWESPAWLRDVKGVMNWNYGESSMNLERYREAVEAYDDGILLVMIGGVFHNTRDFLSDPIVTPAGLELPAAQLKAVVDGLHALSPRLKVGPMTWQWGFGDLDPVFRQHPEWTVHDGQGQPVFAATGWHHEKVYSQLLTPACLAYNLGQFRGLMERYAFDFIYMDTGQGGVTRFDWRTRWGAQDYHWADLYKGIRDAARLRPGGATFFNGTPRLYSQYADCGYFEGMGFVKVHTWEAMSDRLLLVKLYQPGAKWTMPLYWEDSNLDEFASYCYLLGLKPSGLGDGGSLRRWPLVQAANELAAARLVSGAAARPCWWQERGDVECYALRLAGGGLLNAYWHGRAAGPVTTSCLVGPLGLDPARPIHAWLFRPRAATEVMAQVKLTEADAKAIFRRDGTAPYRVMRPSFLGSLKAEAGRVSVTYELGPAQVGVVLLTQAERLAYALDGRPCQLFLPAPEGMRAETLAAGEPLPAEVARRFVDVPPPAGVASAILEAARSSPTSANRQVQEVGKTVAGVEVLRLLTIDCDHNREDQATAALDGDRLRLVADMGADKLYGFASAGVEGANLGHLSLRVTLAEPLYKRFSLHVPQAFAGLVADYHTATGYRRRVRFGLIPCQPGEIVAARPWWGAFSDLGKAPEPLLVDWSEQFKPGTTRDLDLDLGRYAPADWDGRVLFGPAVDSCGLGSRIDVLLLANGKAGPREANPFAVLTIAAKPDGTAVFQGARISRFEDGARLANDRVLFPPNACIEASGLKVITWDMTRAVESKTLLLMINYQVGGQAYKLVERRLDDLVKPGTSGRFDLDLAQFAPPGWTGTVRLRLRGDQVEAALVANATFQPF